jgi:hypothetical protein
LLLLGVASLLWADGPAGEIRLEVKDPSGAAMEVSGKLENLANGTNRSFRTDALGKYALKSVPYGRYRLLLSSSGFAAQSLLIDVQSDAPISRTITMLLGAATANVTVVATTPLAGVDLSSSKFRPQCKRQRRATSKRAGR